MPTTILHIDSSPLGDRSVSRKLTAKILDELKAKYPDNKVITRDLSSVPFPHLSGLTIASFFTPPDQQEAALAEAGKLSNQAVDELLAADIVVIGVPMWNFGIPSSLKAWIDHVVRAGRTFQYASNGSGPKGLLSPKKKAIIVLSRGGVYSTGAFKMMDYQETYLKAVLNFMGLTDISFVRAEGISMGEEAFKDALASADKQIAEALQKAG